MADFHMVNDNSFDETELIFLLSIGYEYMGLNGRLVITPLTDRIYLTITQVDKNFNNNFIHLIVGFVDVSWLCTRFDQRIMEIIFLIVLFSWTSRHW